MSRCARLAPPLSTNRVFSPDTAHHVTRGAGVQVRHVEQWCSV